MFLLDDFYPVPELFENFNFIVDNIDLIERCIFKADMMFEAFFTEAWIQMEDE